MNTRSSERLRDNNRTPGSLVCPTIWQIKWSATSAERNDGIRSTSSHRVTEARRTGGPAEAMGEFEPIPYRIWIGVTGHRDAPPDPRIEEQVRSVLDRVRAQAAKAGFPDVRFGVVSALAEGPDQYVARVVLEEPGALLAAVLPMPAVDYRRSLADAASRAEFDRLLELACDVRAFEPGGDPVLGTDGYSAAGTAIIE